MNIYNSAISAAIGRLTVTPSVPKHQWLIGHSVSDQAQVAFYLSVNGNATAQIYYRVKGTVITYAAVSVIFHMFDGQPLHCFKTVSKKDLVNALEIPEQLSHRLDIVLRTWEKAIESIKK